jgi:hypothetical protein
MTKGFLLADGSIRDPVQDPVDRISDPSSVYSNGRFQEPASSEGDVLYSHHESYIEGKQER